jgi:hypothetical protein
VVMRHSAAHLQNTWTSPSPRTFRRCEFPWRQLAHPFLPLCHRRGTDILNSHDAHCTRRLPSATAPLGFQPRATSASNLIDSHVTLAWDGTRRVGVIVLNDPLHYNALSVSLCICSDLANVVERASTFAHAHSLVLQAAGAHFCVGANPFDKHVEIHLASLADSWHTIARNCCKLRELTCPVIAAVHGHMAGGGIALCLNASSRVSDASATFEHGNLPRGTCERSYSILVATWLADTKLSTRVLQVSALSRSSRKASFVWRGMHAPHPCT